MPGTAPSVSLAPAKVIRCSFSDTGSGLLTSDMELVGNGGVGMTVSQADGNLNIVTGASANAEFLARTKDYVANGIVSRWKVAASQRIVNQHLVIALADKVGDNLVYTAAADGLSVVVQDPGRRFTSRNIGQTVFVGGVTGAATYCPGRYTITAVAVQGAYNEVTLAPIYTCSWTRSSTTATVTFLNGGPIFALNQLATVSLSSDVSAIVNGVVTLLTQASGGVTTFTCLNAGATSGTLTLQMHTMAWTANATGTLCLYGHNTYEQVYNGTSATTAWFDSRRRGRGLGATSVTTATTASPGYYGQIRTDTTQADNSSGSVGSSTSNQFSQIGSRAENLPDGDVGLHLYVQAFNGVSAPASTTTWTLGFLSLEEVDNVKVHIAGQTQGPTAPTVVVTQGTGSSLNAQVTGAAAQGATASGNPVLVGAVAKTAQPTARTDGQIVAPLFSKVGHEVGRLGHVRDLCSDPAMVTLSSTTETTLVAAVASTFNDLAGLVISSTAVFTGTPTGVRLDFRDTTAGTVRFSIALNPTAAAGQNLSQTWLGQELKQATVNTNWTVQLAFVGGTTPGVGSGDIRITPKIVANI